MEILRFFESIRTPIGDFFFSLITHLGEETLFIIIGLLFFWCINKKEGYYLLSVGLTGTILNQFLNQFLSFAHRNPITNLKKLCFKFFICLQKINEFSKLFYHFDCAVVMSQT